MLDRKPQIEEVQKTSSSIKTKHTNKSIPRHIIFKLLKIKDTEKNPEEGRGQKTPSANRKKGKNYILTSLQTPYKEKKSGVKHLTY